MKYFVHACVLASLVVCCQTLAEDSGPDVTEISLEQLLETEFIPARRIAQQISDASSAVSIVTAQDINDYGYRSLIDILRSMRGLFVTEDFQYGLLGGRGFGIPGDYAGRIMLLIDGTTVSDNIYGQAFFGEDAFIDVALIERVEYVPGPGSTSYGNGAFLGSINITTKSGRDIGGTQLALDFGNKGERRQRLTYGNRLKNGAEVLISASRYEDDGLAVQFPILDDWVSFTGDAFTNQIVTPLKQNENKRLFFKAAYEGWSSELAYVDRQATDNSFYDLFEPADLDNLFVSRDRSLFASVNHDRDISDTLTSSTQLFYGEYRYNSDTESILDAASAASTGQWWGVDAKFVGTWFNKHRLLFGFEYRDDFKQQLRESFDSDFFGFFDDSFDRSQETVSAYIQDEFRFSEKLTVNSGLRFDDNSRYGSALSPRVALIAAPWPGGNLKLSYGQAFRFKTPWENYTGIGVGNDQEKIRTAEIVLRQNLSKRTLFTLSVYENEVEEAISFDFSEQKTFGQELGFEYLNSKGLRLNLSAAHQDPTGDFFFSDNLFNSPDWLYKLNLSQPLFDHKLVVGVDANHVSRRLNFSEEYIPASTVVNLTLSTNRLIPGLNAHLSFRNLLGDAPRDIVLLDLPIEFPANERGIWLQLEYSFK